MGAHVFGGDLKWPKTPEKLYIFKNLILRVSSGDNKESYSFFDLPKKIMFPPSYDVVLMLRAEVPSLGLGCCSPCTFLGAHVFGGARFWG